MKFPKGPTRKQTKAKRARLEAKVIKAVRAKCVKRDGYCRASSYWGYWPDGCHGRSEHAHLGEWKRFKTRGLPPEERHSTKGSLMLCEKHHDEYDAGELVIEYGELGADGPLKVYRKAA